MYVWDGWTDGRRGTPCLLLHKPGLQCFVLCFPPFHSTARHFMFLAAPENLRQPKQNRKAGRQAKEGLADWLAALLLSVQQM